MASHSDRYALNCLKIKDSTYSNIIKYKIRLDSLIIRNDPSTILLQSIDGMAMINFFPILLHSGIARVQLHPDPRGGKKQSYFAENRTPTLAQESSSKLSQADQFVSAIKQAIVRSRSEPGEQELGPVDAEGGRQDAEGLEVVEQILVVELQNVQPHVPEPPGIEVGTQD